MRDAVVLDNGILGVTFGERGIASLALRGAAPANTVAWNVTGDEFAFELSPPGPRLACSSASLIPPTIAAANSSHCTLRYSCSPQLVASVTYALLPASRSVAKSLSLSWRGRRSRRFNVTNVTLLDGVALRLAGRPADAAQLSRSHYGLGDYALFCRWPNASADAGAGAGVMLSARNPYLRIGAAGAASAASATLSRLSLSYAPLAQWRSSAPFEADAAVLAAYRLSGRRLPPPADPLDTSEHAAMVGAVREAAVAPSLPGATVKINVGWCENDYQLDIANPSDRAEYKRIIDRAASLGLTHLTFAPRNSEASSRANNTDAWGWEQLLWFGMGQRLRLGEWRPGDALPPSLVEMLDHFRLRRVRPVAYVYPILAFLAGTLPNGTSPPWIVRGDYAASELESKLRAGPLRSNLGSPELQTWLPDTLLRFARATGAGGFSFDYTYFEERPPISSQYEQWSGWRAILGALHTADAAEACGGRCVVDSRQQNHAWGPWMWSQGGGYAEPLMSDEQPESWAFYEPDLHTDRLSANRQRQVAWDYRLLEFCPSEAVPGFAFHQTDRTPSATQAAACADGRCSNSSRRIDFDYLGYRYSLFSSIGTAGLNSVLNMLPARSLAEFDAFPPADAAFVRGWLDWADEHTPLLLRTRPILSLSRPGRDQLDGTAMVADGSGVAFLFNPTARRRDVRLRLDTLGFECAGAGEAAGPPLTVRQIGSSGYDDAPHLVTLVDCAGTLNLTLPPTTALVLGLEPLGCVSGAPQLYGAPYVSARVNASAAGAALALDGVRGEAGTTSSLTVLLPDGTPPVRELTLNGKRVGEYSSLRLYGSPAVRLSAEWAGPHFPRAAEVRPSEPDADPSADPSEWRGTFTVPAAALDQLRERNRTYAVEPYDTDPSSNDDANVAWLAPGRLLLSMPGLPDTANVSGAIDGTPLLIRRAYNTIAPKPRRFIGHWADATAHVTAGVAHTLTLRLPAAGWTSRVGALAAGDDALRLDGASLAEARSRCAALDACGGFTWRADGAPCDRQRGAADFYLKRWADGANDDPGWCTELKPPAFGGVHFENVETIYTAELAGSSKPARDAPAVSAEAARGLIEYE